MRMEQVYKQWVKEKTSTSGKMHIIEVGVYCYFESVDSKVSKFYLKKFR